MPGRSALDQVQALRALSEQPGLWTWLSLSQAGWLSVSHLTLKPPSPLCKMGITGYLPLRAWGTFEGDEVGGGYSV